MNNYVENAVRTENKDYDGMKQRLQDTDTLRLMHAAFSLATETGEFLDALKKHIFYGKPFDKVNAVEELGDIMWGLALACDVLGVDFSAAQHKNIAKLSARYPNKFTAEAALNRDLSKGRDILEG